VFTGGTAKLNGLDDFARSKLQLAARIAKLENIGGLVDTVEDQSFTVVIGLMLLDMLLLPSLEPQRNSSRQAARGAIGSLLGRFKRP
jgi:cell division protein FtsA